jgi:hypothetical protein
VVYDSCKELGIPWASAQYVILGDDVLFGDPVLAEAYRRRIESLGVPVSLEKTLVSRDTLEFAKRYVHQGEEITPFPISAVVDTAQNVSLLVSALYGEQKRALVPRSGIPGAVYQLYRTYLHRNPRSCRKARDEAVRVLAGLDYSSGHLTRREFLGILAGQHACPRVDDTITDAVCDYIFDSAIRDLFSKAVSVPRLKLGLVPLELIQVIEGMGDYRLTSGGLELAGSLPVVDVYSQLIQMFDKSLSGHQLARAEGEEYDDLVRAIQLPLSDKLLLIPVREQRAVMQGRFAASLLKNFRSTAQRISSGELDPQALPPMVPLLPEWYHIGKLCQEMVRYSDFPGWYGRGSLGWGMISPPN